MPRDWGPDENGRWGNKMMGLRDDTAERNVRMYRKLSKLIPDVRRGDFTRAGLERDLNDLRDLALRCVLNLQDAGAPIRPDALDSIEDLLRR